MLLRRGSFMLYVALLLAAILSPAVAQSTSPIQNPANGHWYQTVRVAGAISWDNARAAAESLSHAGLRGHLLTVTSAAEMEFVARSVLSTVAPSDQLWLGGYQDTGASDYVESRGAWRWVTGEPWSYTHWETGQPDNYGGNEDALDFHHGEVWNDFPRSSGLHGYVVEYEPLPIATGPLLSIEPNPVVGGQPATAQVILGQPAGLGGVVLTLSTSNPAAAVPPASVTVPTGANTLSFPITTFSVASPAEATISVNSAVGGASTTLKVIPDPAPAPPQPVYNPANGHWYQVIRPKNRITWPEARAAAERLSFGGHRGHLATITSAAENEFVVAHLLREGGTDTFLGGYQDRGAPDYREPAGGWRWVTGEPWIYTSWHSDQPDNNNGGTPEHVLETTSTGIWNDFPEGFTRSAYLVEYEPQSSPVTTTQLVLFPNPVPGGLLALGQVVLAQPAGAGGATVALTSSHPAVAMVPAAIPVLPGAATATFAILTFPVATATPVQIMVGGSPVAATLQVLPLSVLPPPPPTGFNLLINGSFEDPRGSPHGLRNLPGWRMTRGTVDILTEPGWQAAHGQQMLDLVGTPGAATIEQSFATEPGREYRFSGWISHHPEISEGRANVYLNETLFVQLYHPESDVRHRTMRWVPFTYRFRATSSTTTLRLEDVTNIRNDGMGLFLDGLSVIAVHPTPLSPARPPAAPSEMRAERVTATRVDLRWRDNSDNEQEFIVWRRSGSSDFVEIGSVGTNVTTFTDTKIRARTTYTYMVRPWNAQEGLSAPSNEITVTIPAPEPTGPLNPPVALRATVVGVGEIRLTWTDETEGEAVFVVYRRGLGDADFVKLSDVPANGTTYLDRSLAPGTTYTYLVRAWHPARGVSRRSNEATATTPQAQ